MVTGMTKPHLKWRRWNWSAKRRLAYSSKPDRSPAAPQRHPDAAPIRILYRGMELVGEVVVMPVDLYARGSTTRRPTHDWRGRQNEHTAPPGAA